MLSAVKPFLRGRFHEAAFYIALGACLMLLIRSRDSYTMLALLIYSLSLMTLFGVSALYHRFQWQDKVRMWLRRLDHSAIFILIAGTGTPLCMLSIPEAAGRKLLGIFWAAAAVGIVQSLFWVRAPKWVTAILYVAIGWLALPYLPEFKVGLGTSGVVMLLAGGIAYTVGAIIYAFKRPNPYPKVFGYHEIFHILVIVGAAFHFVLVARIVQ